MPDQSSIEFISGLVKHPAALQDADRQRVAALAAEYPYLLPVRYVLAADRQLNGGDKAELLSAVRPYLGNWLLFCDFIDGIPAAGLKLSEPIAEIAEEPTAQQAEPVVFEATNTTAIAEPLPVADIDLEEANIPEETDLPMPSVAAAAEPAMEEEILPQSEPRQTQQGHIESVLGDAVDAINHKVTDEEQLILPVYTEDYFMQQGVKVPDELPDQIEDLKKEEEPGSLMVMMSFAEWLLHFRNTSQKAKEEDEEQKALKAMWQKEKLAAAIEEENDEIPENVFEMAVTSITNEDDLASESLANIYLKQGKYDKAIDMYRKLSLRNPQKNAYFANKIEEILKEKQS